MKNLFEKTLCEQRIGKDIQGVAVDWYFKTINQLYCAGDRALFDRRENARFEECAQIVQRAIETRDGIEVIKLVPKIYQDEVRHRFDNLIEKKNPDTDNVAACRAYVAAFINFIRYLHRLSTGRTGSTNPMEHQS